MNQELRLEVKFLPSMPRVLSLILSMVVDTGQEVDDTKIVSVSLRLKLERLNARYTYSRDLVGAHLPFEYLHENQSYQKILGLERVCQ